MSDRYSNTEYDVAIIGLGPVGATAANLLGRDGYKTTVIEREKDIYPKPRAIAFDHEIMRIFQSIGLSEDVLPCTTRYRPALYLGIDGQIIRRIDPSPEPFQLHWMPNYLFDQPCLETTLRKGIERFETVGVRLEHELVSLKQEPDCIQLTINDLKAETEYEISTRYVWACDGAGSPVRRSLGLTLEDLDFDEEWIVIDVKVNDTSTLPETNIQYCEPPRPSTYVIGPGNHRRWELMLNPGETAEEISNEGRILELLSRWGDPSNFNIWRAAVYRFHALVAEQWSKGRIFLVGDSAHQTPPFMGQGMCQGIRDTNNLIWKLNQVERFGGRESLFSHYQIERKPHVKALTEFTKSLGETICERDTEKAKIRDARLIEELESGRMETVRQGLIPNLVDGILHLENGEPVGPAGRLFPQPTVDDGTKPDALLDDVLGRGFFMVTRDGSLLKELSEEQLNWFEAVGGQAKVISETDSSLSLLRATNSVLSSFFDEWKSDLLLVRPDKYVFGAASDSSETKALLDRLKEYLT